MVYKIPEWKLIAILPITPQSGKPPMSFSLQLDKKTGYIHSLKIILLGNKNKYHNTYQHMQQMH